jgi:hypothetical protein
MTEGSTAIELAPDRGVDRRPRETDAHVCAVERTRDDRGRAEHDVVFLRVLEDHDLQRAGELHLR